MKCWNITPKRCRYIPMYQPLHTFGENYFKLIYNTYQFIYKSPIFLNTHMI